MSTVHNRRDFFRNKPIINRMYKKSTLLLSALLSASVAVASDRDSTEIVRPNDRQLEWADAEIGVIIHFDMPVYHPDYSFRQWGTHPDASTFNPTQLDTDQWLEAASKLGARYAVLVAKHCSGFSLWPTAMHDYSIKNSPWKNGEGDIVADFIASCKKYGIKPGIYASTTANGYLHVDNPGLVQEGAPVTQEEYNRIVTGQLTELWSNYGDLFEIWFDDGVLSTKAGGADVLSLVKRLQPDAVAFQGPYGHPNLVRWVGNEEGVAPEPCWATADSTTTSAGTLKISGLHGRADAPFWCPGEADFTLRHNGAFQGGWFWKEGEDDRMFNVNQLMRKYETSVGRNTNMLLGIVVDDRGLVPDADFNRLEEFGREIVRQYGSPLKEASGSGETLTVSLDRPTEVDRLFIQENIANGECIIEYRVMGHTPDNDWVELTRGTGVGHKRIARFPATKVDTVRLEVTEAKATPAISRLAVFEKISTESI